MDLLLLGKNLEFFTCEGINLYSFQKDSLNKHWPSAPWKDSQSNGFHIGSKPTEDGQFFSFFTRWTLSKTHWGSFHGVTWSGCILNVTTDIIFEKLDGNAIGAATGVWKGGARTKGHFTNWKNDIPKLSTW